MPLTKEQIEELCKAKNYSAEKTAKIVAHLTGEDELNKDVNELLDLPFTRHSTFSSEMDKLRAYKKTLDMWRQNEVLPVLEKAKKATEETARYKAQYGELDDESGGSGGGDPQPQKKDGMNGNGKESIEDIVKRERQQFLQAQLDQNKLMRKHAQYFPGEILDLEGVWEKVAEAAETGQPITLEEAHNLIYGDKIKEIDTKRVQEHDAALVKKGRDLERQELLQRGALRAGAAIREDETDGPLFEPVKEGDKPLDDQQRLSAFANDLGNPDLVSSAAT